MQDEVALSDKKFGLENQYILQTKEFKFDYAKDGKLARGNLGLHTVDMTNASTLQIQNNPESPRSEVRNDSSCGNSQSSVLHSNLYGARHDVPHTTNLVTKNTWLNSSDSFQSGYPSVNGGVNHASLSSGSPTAFNSSFPHQTSLNHLTRIRPHSVMSPLQNQMPQANVGPCRAITGHQNFLPQMSQVLSQNRHSIGLTPNNPKPLPQQNTILPQLPPWVGHQVIPNNIGSWNGAPNQQLQRRSVPNMAALLHMTKSTIQQPAPASIPTLSPASIQQNSTVERRTALPQSNFGQVPFDVSRANARVDERGSPYQDCGSAYDSMQFQDFESTLLHIMQGQGDTSDQMKGKPFGFGTKNCFPVDENTEKTIVGLPSPQESIGSQASGDMMERYSRKVFVGGLPPDIDEEEISAAFRGFGPLVVDWPHKAESKSYFPPKGYCFLLFQEEVSVQALIQACFLDVDKLYWCVTSPTMQDKAVQIRPWNLKDSDFVMDGSQTLDPRKTIFVGGVPRPLRAVELANIMDRLYGGVCYAGIDTDPELKYPKGAGRVAFSNQQSYIAAISARFVQLQHGEIDKRVEVKPYVLDDQMCDECQGTRCAGKFAPFFCASITCLQYYCEQCWAQIHSRQGREFHKPLVKEGADRPRAVPFRWC